MEYTPKEILDKVKEYVHELNEYSALSSRTSWNVYTFTTGSVYFKVVNETQGKGRIFCFIEKATGDILKAATWSQPAVGKRGNIFDEKRPLELGQLYKR